MTYKGRTVIVTGTGTTEGVAVALQLTRDGARTIANYLRSGDEAKAVANPCRDRLLFDDGTGGRRKWR